MRILVAFVLIFGLLLNGHGVMAFVHDPCATQMSLDEPAGADLAYDLPNDNVDPTVVDASDDCCVDAETAARTGSPCKTGQACVSGIVTLPAADLVLTFPKADTAILFASPHAFPAVPPATIWRPPTLFQSQA